MQSEIWKSISGYEGLYEVSNLGNVRSVDRVVQSRWGDCKMKGRILKPGITKQGYFVVVLCKDGVMKTFKKSRLVAIAFIPNPENKREVNHVKGIKTDDRVTELEWSSPSENVIHARDKLHMSNFFSKRNVPSNQILTDAKAAEIRYRFANENITQVQLGKEYGVTNAAISMVIRKKNFAHVI